MTCKQLLYTLILNGLLLQPISIHAQTYQDRMDSLFRNIKRDQIIADGLVAISCGLCVWICYQAYTQWRKEQQLEDTMVKLPTVDQWEAYKAATEKNYREKYNL